MGDHAADTQDQKVAEPPKPSTARSTSKSAATTSLLSIDVLNLIKTAQVQHGLRHGDYARYRQYCTRRLTRLRKSLGFMHGKGRFTQKKIEVKIVTQDRHLLIPLYNAERAWSYAMELKEYSDNPRARFHLMRRLKKAVDWSHKLMSLCAETTDDRTKLEVEAYACWMSGNLLLEQEDWAEALTNFSRARTIYDRLSKVGDTETQETFKQRVQEIDPTIRFCNYNLSQKGEDLSGLRAGQEGPAADVLLQAKLDKVLAETRKKHGETMKEVTWCRKTVPIKSDKLREYILGAQERIFEVEKVDSLDAKLELYDKSFISLNDALNIIRDDLRQFATGQKKNLKVEQQESELRFLRDYVSYLKLSKTVDRNLLLVNSLIEKLETNAKGDNKQRPPNPKEIVKLYDTLIQNVSEMTDLRDADEDEYHKQIAAMSITFKAFRCYYVGCSYFGASKWGETLALFQRAMDYTKSAIAHHELCAKPSEVDIVALKRLEAKVRGKKCAAQAKASMESMPQADQQEELQTPRESILQNLDSFNLDPKILKGQLIDFPPDFAPIPCKPILFDLALNSIEFPDLSNRKKAKGGFFSFWRS